RPVAGPERRVQGAGPGQRADEGGCDLPAAPRRGRAHRAGHRAGHPGRARAPEGPGRAVRPRPAERAGQPGVSTGRGGAGEFRETDGEGERPHLRGHEAGGREPHHHPGLTVPGLFIAVEGPEGAGKTSLARALAARLVAGGRQVVSVREPGGTPVAEAARRVQGPGVVNLDGTQSKEAVLDAAWREVLAAAPLSTRGVS